MGEQRRGYDRAFKYGAVKLVVEGGRSVAEAARNLGIHENLLHKGKKQYEEDREYAFPGNNRLKAPDEVLRKLQRELADVREERDILKKALAIFSQGPR